MKTVSWMKFIVTMILLAATPCLKAQLASAKVPATAALQLKRSNASGVAVNHHVLTGSNSDQLSSNRITSTYAEERIPAPLKSRGILQSRSHGQGSPAVLPSNSKTLAQRGHPKRPPALPVSF